MQKGESFVLSTDIWTIRRGHSFLGIVASFIDGFSKEKLFCQAVGTYRDTTPQTIYQIFIYLSAKMY